MSLILLALVLTNNNTTVYGSPKDALGGKSLNDLHIQCVEDKAFKQYVSKSHVVNAFMVAPTTLLYTIPFNQKNFDKVRDLSIGYVATWLDMLAEEDGPLVKGLDSKDVQTELLRLDVRTRQFCGRDPDTKNVANLFGLELTDKVRRLLYFIVWHHLVVVEQAGWECLLILHFCCLLLACLVVLILFIHSLFVLSGETPMTRFGRHAKHAWQSDRDKLIWIMSTQARPLLF